MVDGLAVPNGFTIQIAYCETKIRHEIILSRKSPGQVSNVTFPDLLPEQ